MKRILSAALIAIFAVTILSTCKNPPIFAAIEQEVKLKPASIKAFVRGLVKIGNTLYVSNGKLFYKTFGSTGTWSSMGSPGGLCVGLATDGTRLYGIFANDSSFTAMMYTTSWGALPAGCSNASNFIAGTQTVFAADNTTVYAIEHGVTMYQWSLGGGHPVGAARTYCLLDNGLRNNTGALIGGSPTSGLKGICEGPPNSVFIFDRSTLFCYQGAPTDRWTHIGHGVSNPLSITYLPNKQLVLISGKNGYNEIKIAGNNLANAFITVAGAADSSIPLSNLYQYKSSVGKWHVNPIVAFDYDVGGYIIYTGVLDPTAKHTGLWGFYAPGQTEWNRE